MFSHGFGVPSAPAALAHRVPSLTLRASEMTAAETGLFQRVVRVGRSVALATVVAEIEICFETKGERI